MTATVASAVRSRHAELVALRRDLHAHPELGRQERRTTERVRAALVAAGLSPQPLPAGTGLLCDVGPAGPRVALRADLDALPVTDAKSVPYRSTVDGVCHACGHDVHTAVVLGAALALAERDRGQPLPHGVRLVFQPAEEVMPGGALDVLAAGALDGVERIYAVHCDPAVTVGKVGLRVGAVTSASDGVEVRLRGPGGHTARPHLTADLVTALGALAAGLPALLARRVDPRAGVNLAWGQVSAGTAANVIPRTGTLRGTLRILDRDLWATVPTLLAELARELVAAYGVEVEVVHTRGVPPVVNDAAAVADLQAAAQEVLAADSVVDTRQSLGGEDFGWYLERVPGALVRLGVRPAGVAAAVDLHQPAFDVDEQCIGVGAALLAAAALRPLP